MNSSRKFDESDSFESDERREPRLDYRRAKYREAKEERENEVSREKKTAIIFVAGPCAR